MRDQRELAFRRQQHRVWAEQVEQSIRQRIAHMRRFRDLLTRREESLERDRARFDEHRRTVEREFEADRTAFAEERTRWIEERDATRTELKRRQEILTLHAENLESRRQRLDRLRDELERTNRETLEIRLAVEQTWSELTETEDPQLVMRRVESARLDLNDHYQRRRDTIASERAELQEIEQELVRRREAFRQERGEFAGWITQREEQLAIREQALNAEMKRVREREEGWQMVRERWQAEKLEAEAVIRDLLSQLEAVAARSVPPQVIPPVHEPGDDASGPSTAGPGALPAPGSEAA